jgi:hypothetical protein
LRTDRRGAGGDQRGGGTLDEARGIFGEALEWRRDEGEALPERAHVTVTRYGHRARLVSRTLERQGVEQLGACATLLTDVRSALRLYLPPRLIATRRLERSRACLNTPESAAGSPRQRAQLMPN